MNTPPSRDSFYVAAYEAGAEHPSLPTWASNTTNPAELAAAPPLAVSRKDVAEVPGAFQLLNVLSAAECQRLIEQSEALGFLPDAAVSLPRDIRHNDSLTWVVDEPTAALIWQRVTALSQDTEELLFDGKPAVGLNARFRFYRYGVGDYFKPHTDGAWPGSGMIEGQLVSNAFADRYSQMSFLIFLSGDYSGGATRFFVNADEPGQPARQQDRVKEVDVRTPAGSVLCFPHGMHPLHCVHSSEPIYEGVKYIIRTDMLFKTS